MRLQPVHVLVSACHVEARRENQVVRFHPDQHVHHDLSVYSVVDGSGYRRRLLLRSGDQRRWRHFEQHSDRDLLHILTKATGW